MFYKLFARRTGIQNNVDDIFFDDAVYLEYKILRMNAQYDPDAIDAVTTQT